MRCNLGSRNKSLHLWPHVSKILNEYLLIHLDSYMQKNELEPFEWGNGFLDITPNTQAAKRKIGKLVFNKM